MASRFIGMSLGNITAWTVAMALMDHHFAGALATYRCSEDITARLTALRCLTDKIPLLREWLEAVCSPASATSTLSENVFTDSAQ
jgi:hypothetical protein